MRKDCLGIFPEIRDGLLQRGGAVQIKLTHLPEGLGVEIRIWMSLRRSVKAENGWAGVIGIYSPNLGCLPVHMYFIVFNKYFNRLSFSSREYFPFCPVFYKSRQAHFSRYVRTLSIAFTVGTKPALVMEQWYCRIRHNTSCSSSFCHQSH
jgi:hypothetical protein